MRTSADRRSLSSRSVSPSSCSVSRVSWSNSAYLYVWSGRVQTAAQLGAQSGADAVDPRYLYNVTVPCTAAAAGAACPVQIVDVSPRDREGALYAFERSCIEAADQSAQMPRDQANPLVLKTANDPQVPGGHVVRQ